MRNINYRGKYTEETQLIQGQQLPAGAIAFREGNTIADAFIRGTMITLPLLVAMLVIGVLKILPITTGFRMNASFALYFVAMAVLGQACTYLHELIHALLFPRSAVKEIWKYPSQGALFVYCAAAVSKSRFILICLAPVLLLGILPYALWLFVYALLPVPVSICVAAFAWIMTLSSVGDFFNVFNAIVQVPRGAKIFNYGLHSYWIRQADG